MYDIISGTFLVAGLGEEDFTSLTEEQQKKYMDRFDRPEIFIKRFGEFMAVPIKPSVKDKLKEISGDRKDQADKQLKPPNIDER